MANAKLRELVDRLTAEKDRKAEEGYYELCAMIRSDKFCLPQLIMLLNDKRPANDAPIGVLDEAPPKASERYPEPPLVCDVAADILHVSTGKNVVFRSYWSKSDRLQAARSWVEWWNESHAFVHVSSGQVQIENNLKAQGRVVNFLTGKALADPVAAESQRKQGADWAAELENWITKWEVTPE